MMSIVSNEVKDPRPDLDKEINTAFDNLAQEMFIEYISDDLDKKAPKKYVP